MNHPELKQQVKQTPAFVLDLAQVQTNLQPLTRLSKASGCKVLYSMKALPLAALLDELKEHVDGISVSSLFEARLAKELFAERGSVHLTTPGLRSDELAELGRLCSHISFNSLSQLQNLSGLASGYSKGLRINPKLSFADDQRYDPCRLHSKLGVDIDVLQQGLPQAIEGLHFHTVFGQLDFLPLHAIIAKLQPLLQQHDKLKWLNLGGGYLYHSIAEQTPLIELIWQLKNQFADEVFLEPGNGLVGNAGYLVTTVLDRFDSDGKTVLVLDTSINHLPEVFEYQIKPLLLEEKAQAENSAILVGSTCLAGDIFGEYRFNNIPGVGDKLVFANVGAYSLIKAHRFNGYALPAVYLCRNGKVELIKADDYADYRRQWLV